MDHEATFGIIQASAFYEQSFSGPSLPKIFLHDERRNRVPHRPQSPEMASRLEKNFMMNNCSSESSPTNGLGFQVPITYNLYEEGHSVIGFKPEFRNFIQNRALLTFEPNTNVMPTNNLCSRMMSKEDEYNGWMNVPNCFAIDNILSETSSRHHAAVQFSWPSDQENVINDAIQELGRQETSKNKRPAAGDGVEELKKQCVVSSTKPKSSKSESTAKKDPLSIAAKNRRERISERLKALQELVPNGSKVDLVTMLEKAISYVKFLQLQVKVLATDEFWPSQGGKAPELSQVKEAIDAILGS